MKLSVFHFFSSIDKSFIAIKLCTLIVFVLLFAGSCIKKGNSATAYKSNFNTTTTSSIDATEYWSKNPQDWQISSHGIECLVSNESRKIQLLTRQLGTQEGNLEMTVRLGFYNNKISSLNNNWAGFNLGSKDRVLNFNNKTEYKQGINIGVCTNGSLFIGAPSPNHKNENIVAALKKGIDLNVLISKETNGYAINFSVLEIEKGEVLGHISKKNITSDKFIGNLELVSNFVTGKPNKVNPTKSVWFKDWEIKGTKVVRLKDK
ncbi:hypothetical protein [Gelatiniphilus marinus]|uniref:Uncharacterized protein n=1 Tax=Gelatiniphilus marinus TaxID=1759464 RepID=A0ABW5JWE3_9FLAO